MRIINISSQEAKSLIEENYPSTALQYITPFQYFRQMVLGKISEFTLETGASIKVKTSRTAQGSIKPSGVQWYVECFTNDYSDLSPYISTEQLNRLKIVIVG